MQQPVVNQPRIEVSAPILLKILTTVKRAHKDSQGTVLDELVNTEITELINRLEDEVLTPKWSREVQTEVDRVFSGIGEGSKNESQVQN